MSLKTTLEENEIIFTLNEKIAQLKALVDQLQENGAKSILLSKFEESKINIVYDNGAAVGEIIVDELEVVVTINGKATRIDRNGNIV